MNQLVKGVLNEKEKTFLLRITSCYPRVPKMRLWHLRSRLYATCMAL